MLLYVHRSTETMKIIRDGETRSSTSTFTQLLSSDGEFSGLGEI